MDCPDNLDLFLRALLKEGQGTVQLDEEDKAFIDRILKSITQASKGIFVVLHPNDRMQYMLLNTNRAGAIALLAKVMQRTAEALEADLDYSAPRPFGERLPGGPLYSPVAVQR